MNKLTRTDLQILNAYENLTGKPLTRMPTEKPVITKSELDSQLEIYKITKLNDAFSKMFVTVTENSQAIASKWSSAQQALERLKDEVDLNNFLIYKQFNQIYREALAYIDAYEKQLQETMDNVDDFIIEMKAIVPDKNLLR